MLNDDKQVNWNVEEMIFFLKTRAHVCCIISTDPVNKCAVVIVINLQI